MPLRHERLRRGAAGLSACFSAPRARRRGRRYARGIVRILNRTVVNRTLLLPLALAAAAPSLAAEPVVWIGRFATGLEPWRELRLPGVARANVFAAREWDGVAALEVRSQASMSLLARALPPDLARTPVLCWRWRVDAPLVAADLARKAGDDYAARLYVAARVPPERMGFALRTQLRLARAVWGPELPDAAVNYVWDNRHPPGTERPNAYTERTVMIVQRSGAAEAGRWVAERRDVAADLERLFGPGTQAVQLALAADTDNTGEAARAGFADIGFADIGFVARGEACP